MSEIEAQRAILKEVVKSIIRRIKALKVELISDKELLRQFGGYEDCGSSYEAGVERTEAKISELIDQKIHFEKWRTKLKYEASEKK